MKQGIHPTYFEEATITCACGAVLHTGSTVEKMHTEICSQCHPFYTGKKKFIDATGRVDRFKKLSERAAAKKETLKPKKAKLAHQSAEAEGGKATKTEKEKAVGAKKSA
jgi:large subunit ribosomal protein L31